MLENVPGPGLLVIPAGMQKVVDEEPCQRLCLRQGGLGAPADWSTGHIVSALLYTAALLQLHLSNQVTVLHRSPYCVKWRSLWHECQLWPLANQRLNADRIFLL